MASKTKEAAPKKTAPPKTAKSQESTAPKKRAPPKKRAAAPTDPAKRPKPTGAKARAAAVKKILINVEKKMKAEDVKATLGDYIRLVQLQKEMSDEPKTEIKATWVPEPELSTQIEK